MKTHIIQIFVLFLSFSMFSCLNRTKELEKESLTNAIKNYYVKSQYKWIVILPGVGCHGCIQEGEFFMKKHISNTKILFVLTNITSLKIFQQKTGLVIRKHSNVYIDKDNSFKVITENAVYPCVVYIKNGIIQKYNFQSSQTHALYNIEKDIQ